MESTNDLCFSGLRIYRNSVVEHIRVVLKAKYPDDWESRVSVGSDKDAWKTARDNAAASRAAGRLSRGLADEADLLDVNHFHSRFEKYFDDLFPSQPGDAEETRKQTRRAVLSWAQTVSDYRNPVIGHPATEDVDPEDARAMLDAARRILLLVDDAAANQVHDLMRKLWAEEVEILEPRRLESETLPSREAIAPSFIGREQELADLREWFKDPHCDPLHYLVGAGGKGKTAIAYHFAEEVINQPPPGLEIVIWMSAKLRQYVEGRTANIEDPNFFDLNSALDWLLWAYGSPGFQGMTLDTKTSECLEYLKEFPALVVVDDVDSLEGEAEAGVLYFLNRLPRENRSRFLLTSRRRYPATPQDLFTEVTGFKYEEGRQFIDSRVRMFGLDPALFPPDVVNRILEVCDHSPLFVLELLRLIVLGLNPDQAIEEWQEHRGEGVREYALRRELDLLSQDYPSAQKILLVCALFPEPVTRDEIKEVANVSYAECDETIGRLQNLFLVPKPSLIEDKPRFALDLNTKNLVLEVEGESRERGRIERAIRSIRGSRLPSERGGVGMYIQQALNAVNRGRQSEAERILKAALGIYADDRLLHSRLGELYRKWEPSPQIHAARDHFQRAGELKHPDVDTYSGWFWMEMQMGEWSRAAEAAEKGIANRVDPLPELYHRAGIARSRLAEELRRQLAHDRANQEAQKAENHFRAALSRVAEIRRDQNQFRAKVYGDIVAHRERLARTFQGPAQSRRLNRLAEVLERWQQDLPNDTKVAEERQRLLKKFPTLKDYLDG